MRQPGSWTLMTDSKKQCKALTYTGRNGRLSKHMNCRWLKPGGAVLPDIASIHLAAAGPGATGLCFWQKVYGFDYSLVQQELLEDAHKTALVKAVSRQDLLSTSCCVCQLDLASMTTADCDFNSDFVLEADSEV